MSSATSKEEVVSQGDTVARSYLMNLVLTIAVECRPLDFGWVGAVNVRPIEDKRLFSIAVVGDTELTTFVLGGESDDQTSDLVLASGCVDMRLELPIRCTVHVELVELSLKGVGQQ